MSATFLMPRNSYSYRGFESSGVSDDAKTVQSRFRDVEKSEYSSVTLGQLKLSLIQTVFETYKEASSNNWDGYGAKAISVRTLYNSLRFINSFPLNFPMPEVSAEPDGEISFDWQVAPYKIFSVSVGENNELSYAGLFGSNKTHGTELLVNGFPKALMEQLSRVYT